MMIKYAIAIAVLLAAVAPGDRGTFADTLLPVPPIRGGPSAAAPGPAQGSPCGHPGRGRPAHTQSGPHRS
jgi:hypothetical protein